jgi:hypothetical protein
MVVMSFLALKLSFQLPKDCDHDVDKLGAHMKPFFGPTWRKLLYEEARGAILAILLYGLLQLYNSLC